MKRKLVSIIIVGIMIAACLAGCGTAENDSSDSDKLSVVTTIFPAYDLTREIVGDNSENVDITMLIDNGVDLHSFQPTSQDMAKIASCDVFIYVGGESDKWVEAALKNATNKDMIVINLIDILGDDAKEEVAKEGMESEEDSDHEHDSEDSDAIEYDEHVWLSLENAETCATAISEGLGKADEGNKAVYAENARAYSDKLDKLDDEYEAAVNAGETKNLLFGDRFPFRYLVDEYGLDYYAAFIGCSAETEASFQTITFLSGKVDELGLTKIMVTESSDKKIANTIIENTKEQNQSILVLNSMQSTTSEDVEAGATYLKIMENNLEVLKEAVK